MASSPKQMLDKWSDSLFSHIFNGISLELKCHIWEQLDKVLNEIKFDTVLPKLSLYKNYLHLLSLVKFRGKLDFNLELDA
jgi:hypothetical protein